MEVHHNVNSLWFLLNPVMQHDERIYATGSFLLIRLQFKVCHLIFYWLMQGYSEVLYKRSSGLRLSRTKGDNIPLCLTGSFRTSSQ